LEQIEKSEVVIVWGRNVTVTNAHLMPYLEGKKLIVIDPVRTAIAKRADLFLQVTPRADYDVAMLLSHFILMQKREDKVWRDAFASKHGDFYDMISQLDIGIILQNIDMNLDDLALAADYLRNSKVVFLVGIGVQKYSTGADTLHAIDSLAAILGLFGREGCGVSYLGDSKLGFENPFKCSCKRVSVVDTAFSNFDTVLVQGGNPAESMPESKRVREELEGVSNLIYFGLHENETSKRARIVIPAKSFLEKEDVRLSYGHQYVTAMKKVVDNEVGISEYSFTKVMFDTLGLRGLKSEEHYINTWLSQCKELNGEFVTPAFEVLPYAKGFGEDGEDTFKFMNIKSFSKDPELRNDEADKIYWLVSSKSRASINTQFQRDNRIGLNPAVGYKDGERVKARSAYGEYIFEVHCSEDIRTDCVVINSNTVGVNFLTPSIISQKGESACYQEVKITIESV
ncbi:MAG: molybdopterin oxidoreductase, partial [Epsilonproteobacteria bacterium]